jgi:uncharacterized protein YbcI
VPSTKGHDRTAAAKSISSGIAALHREHYGRGADRVRTSVDGGLVATTLEDCYTTVEKRMIAEGAFDKVRETRTMFQDWMGPHFTEIVEEATGHKVRAFFSQVSHDPDIAIEIFLLEAGRDGEGIVS